MQRAKSKHLALILARELAANVATPMLIVDPDAVLIYFNEAAEALLGETFATTGEIPIGKWAVRHEPEAVGGGPLDIERWVLADAITGRQPAQDTFRFTAADGVRRTVTANVYPLIVGHQEFVGAVSIFWELPGGS
jgi:PAS domain-containing protein